MATDEPIHRPPVFVVARSAIRLRSRLLPEHFGAQGDAPLGLADYDFFLGIADVEGGFAVADHEDDGQGTEASDEHGRHYHDLAGE